MQLFIWLIEHPLLLITLCMFICTTAKAQLTPGQVLRVQPDGVHFELANEYFTPADTTGTTSPIMTYTKASASIATIMTAMAAKTSSSDTAAMLSPYLRTALVTAGFLTGILGSAYATPASVAASYKSITDSGTCLTCYTTGYDLKKSKDSVVALIPSIAGLVATTRTISTTSPLTGGGDLSANKTFAINNAAADGSTKGAASFSTEYFDDNGSGNVNLAFVNGTGSVSANAVTINATKGTITYTSPSISAGNAITVTFTNSYISSTSNVNLMLNSNGANLATNVQVYMKSKSAGSCTFNVANLSLLSLFNSTFLIDFTVIN